MPLHVVFVGLSGSGKSALGALTAERLGAPFADVDALIVRRQGMPVATIFGSQGETGFRLLEQAAMAELLAGRPSVIAPGAGWAAQPGQLEAAKPLALTIYLDTSPAVAVRRLEGQANLRPLLAAGEPLERMRKLLEQREGFYAVAHHRLQTDRRSLDDLADEAAALARAGAGW